MFSPDGSITGGAITGVTSPIFTTVVTGSPAPNAKRSIVSSTAGTGWTLDTFGNAPTLSHNGTSPFDFTWWMPTTQKGLKLQKDSGKFVAGGRNVSSLVIRKGHGSSLYSAGLSPGVSIVTLKFDIAGGSEMAAKGDLQALVSLLIGLLAEESNDVYDSLVTASA